MHQPNTNSWKNAMIAEAMEREIAAWYPGSILAGTYDFIELKGWKWIASTLDSGVAAARMYEELFRIEERLFVTCVQLDLAAYLPAGTPIEERSIAYMPDYHVTRFVPQRFAVIRGRDLNAGGFFGDVIGSYNAAYVFCPRTGFALTRDGCFAPSEEGRAELQRRYPARR